MNNHEFLLVFIVLMALVTLIPLFLKRFQIPYVVAVLIIGMLIGPQALDLIGWLADCLNFFGGDPDTIENSTMMLIDSLGSLGLIFLMTLAGMEADFKLMKMARKPVIALSILTFLIPAVTGYFVYAVFDSSNFAAMLLYASLFASHSVGIVFPVIRELKLVRTRFGVAVLISTIVTDVASIILLAVAVQLQRISMGETSITFAKGLSLFDHIDATIFGNWFTPFFLAVVLLYLGLSTWAVPRVAKLLTKNLARDPDILVTFFLLVVLAVVLLGEMLGVNLIVGAFVAGLGLSRVRSVYVDGPTLFHKMEGIGYGLLIPFLFISIGMKTDIGLFFRSPQNLTIALLTIVGLVGSKIFSGWLAMVVTGFSSAKGLCAGLMTVPQLSATLAAAAVGRDIGLLPEEFFNAIILLSIVTTLPVPTLVRLVITRTKMTFTHIPDGEAGADRLPEADRLPPEAHENELL